MNDGMNSPWHGYHVGRETFPQPSGMNHAEVNMRVVFPEASNATLPGFRSDDIELILESG